MSAELLYPDCKRESYFSAPGDYSPMLESFGSIVLKVDDDDYQGDSRVLYRAGYKIGYLQFGWGSCSGCDALQGCDSYAEIDSLMDGLQAAIIWFDSAQLALEYFNTHDWKGDYSYHTDGQEEFIRLAKELLEQAEPQ